MACLDRRWLGDLVVTFKQRLYRCQQCSQQVKTLAWDTDPPPTCSDHGAMAEDGLKIETHGIVMDTVLGGRVCTTMGHEPFYYDSLSALRKEAERRGVVNVVRHEDAYYVRQRKQHMEQLRDTGQL